MNSVDFNKLKQEMEKTEEGILFSKGTEYIVSTDDRLKFFHEYAEKLGVDSKTVCAIFLMKHINSILNYVKTGKEGAEDIGGRISDARNYLLFMQALIDEKKLTSTNQTYTFKCNINESALVGDAVDLPHIAPSFTTPCTAGCMAEPKLTTYSDGKVHICSNDKISYPVTKNATEDEARSQDFEDKCRWELNADTPIYGEETEVIGD